MRVFRRIELHGIQAGVCLLSFACFAIDREMVSYPCLLESGLPGYLGKGEDEKSVQTYGFTDSTTRRFSYLYGCVMGLPFALMRWTTSWSTGLISMLWKDRVNDPHGC